MGKYFFIYSIFLLFQLHVSGQMYMTRTGEASFFSKTSVEDIKAVNKQAYAIIDVTKKQIAVSLLMKGFEFKKELMQTHFNENYVESDKFPKGVFLGTFTSMQPLLTTGINKVEVAGKLTIHGITKNVILPATFQFLNGSLVGDATFNVSPADYNISIPALVRDNIAKQVQVIIRLNCGLKN